MSELDRLRRLLLTKRERFRSKLGSVSFVEDEGIQHADPPQLHTVSSLKQAETAIVQGENIKTLTEMTVVGPLFSQYLIPVRTA